MALDTTWSDRVDPDAVIQTARDLIRIPSVTGDELAVMDHVQRWAADRGIPFTVVAKDTSRPNVILSLGDSADGPTLVLNGHLDTVPVSDQDAWRTDPYDPVVSEDGSRLFGRGSSDMKSSTGVMMATLELFKSTSLRGCLQAHVVCDEEKSANFGTIVVLDAIAAGVLPRPDYCVIGEKSDLKIRNAERGILGVRITFHGRASHTAAARATGVNAIAKAAKGILALEQDLDAYHPAVGKPVISVNMVQGGVAHNVVPGECAIDVDRRLIPGETKDSVVADMRTALDAVAAGDPLFRYTMDIDPDDDFIAANITEADSPIVAQMQAAAERVTGSVPPYFVQWAGATDGRFYRQRGIDTVGLGPGGENAHGANEAVYVPDLITQAKVYAETIGALLVRA
jgi:acetylornithine deacetylase/succinyl-diaminopimelate desuccinylase family protein